MPRKLIDPTTGVYVRPINSHRSGLKVVLQPTKYLWERQLEESDQAFEAFCIYKHLKENGGSSLADVARSLNKSVALMSRWAIQWSWKERFRSFENQKIIQLEAEQRKAIEARARIWADRKLDIRETGFEVGEKLIARARGLLALPVAEKQILKKITTASGEEVETVTILNFQQHPRDARLMIETGLKLMRLSADMSTENLAIASQNIDWDSMTDEELDSMSTSLMEMRKGELEQGII